MRIIDALNQVVAPYDYLVAILHEGASDGGKREMLAAKSVSDHREQSRLQQFPTRKCLWLAAVQILNDVRGIGNEPADLLRINEPPRDSRALRDRHRAASENVHPLRRAPHHEPVRIVRYKERRKALPRRGTAARSRKPASSPQTAQSGRFRTTAVTE